jgi:hypothetical protein
MLWARKGSDLKVKQAVCSLGGPVKRSPFRPWRCRK